MYNIKLLNKISNVGLKKYDTSKYVYGDDVQNPDAVMVRSASMHDMQMPESLLAIARAGAGTNNIPVSDCADKGIVVFNTPGANANAVKELVILGLLLSSRKVTKAVDWCKTIKGEGDNVGKTVEKGKSAFAGPEIKGKTLGVIGLGAIGRLVAEAAVDLGMSVIGYDPYLPENAELKPGITVNNNLDEIFPVADYITVHVPLTPDTKHMINAESIAKMKNTVRIMNFARGDLADSDAVINALDEGEMACYVTDFPDAKLIGVDGVIAIPHLGASTPESEENCAEMAAQELIDYLEDGNIKNSVNMPNVFMHRTGKVRVTVIHKNQPNMIATITDTISKDGVNIASFEDKNRGEIAYSIIDCDNAVSDRIANDINAIKGVIRVRVI
ncbi:3-phosphoglycerate dehydrogenase family protein [uncultured Eubacterium sp.]|uniref:3-phosphoglycerate dehydrogenase family protein n=1 Tax=uncultured Eubacterium sp. TaxID=165185 RepID=UPI0025FE382F|nr:3-phosphoglycerate dehydrogenase family protein [uncultured Eubacterium sp.]